MPTSSLRSSAHVLLIALLKQARKGSGLRQAQLASRLGVQQSYVAKVEGGERRLDVVEFIRFMRALDADPIAIVREVAQAVDQQVMDASAARSGDDPAD